MRLFLDTALLALVLANTLVDPVDAMPVHAAKRHLRRATDGLHSTALRHTASLARDLRIAFRGLGTSSPSLVAVTNSTGGPAYCVPVPDGSSSQSNTNKTHTHASPGATTSTSKRPSSTNTNTPTSTAQSNFQLAQSYVRLNFSSVCHRPAIFFPLLTMVYICFRSPGTRFSRDGTSSRVPTPLMEMCNM
jgi:hypothetical protein